MFPTRLETQCPGFVAASERESESDSTFSSDDDGGENGDDSESKSSIFGFANFEEQTSVKALDWKFYKSETT